MSFYPELLRVFLFFWLGAHFAWSFITSLMAFFFFPPDELSVQYLFGQDLCVYLASSVHKPSAVCMASMQPILLIF